jgi:glutamate racemase
VGGVVEYLLAEGAEVVVLACNSATIQAVEWCREKWPAISFVGMEPGVKPAVAQTRSGVIGVFATEASLTGEMFARLVARCGSGCEVLTRACPRFVELVEEGIFSGEKVEAAVREYGDELVAAGADVLVLGCTHYHFLEESIQAVYPQAALVNTGAAVARRVLQVWEEGGVNASALRGEIRFLTSGSVARMEKLRNRLVPELNGPVAELPLLSSRAVETLK